MVLSAGFRVRLSLYPGNREIYAREDQRTRQGYRTLPYPDHSKNNKIKITEIVDYNDNSGLLLLLLVPSSPQGE